MLICSKRLVQGRGLAHSLRARAATLTLDWDTRQKSRFEARDSLGRALAVFLARGTVVRGGDVLVAEDGSLLRVVAAPQAVLRVAPSAAAADPAFALMRAAYHLGNRHVPVELQSDHLHLEPDPVLAELLRSLHMTVTPVHAPFEPEGGAYRDNAMLGHSHGHDHGHGHSHGHDHGHDHSHPHGH